MNDELLSSVAEVVVKLEQAGIEHMLVGSVAAAVHGRARTTQDFDFVIEAGPQQIVAFCRSLPEERFYVSEHAAVDAIHRGTQFNVLDMESGWKIDLIVRKHREFSEREFERRRRVRFGSYEIWVASLEDTILAKLEWAKIGGSQRQLEDVKALVAAAQAKLDRRYIASWITRLQLEDQWRVIVANE